MRIVRVTAAALLAVLMSGGLLLLAPAASAQSENASPCAPGQPPGRPPGQSPQQPGQPSGRPVAYPPGQCQLAISQASAARGETIIAAGNGFIPGEQVSLSVGGQTVRSMSADTNGNISGDLTIPDSAPLGRTEIRAQGGAQVLSAAFEVVAAPAAERSRAAAAAGAAVARTGTYIAATGLAGAALVAVGAVLVIGARRRRFATA